MLVQEAKKEKRSAALSSVLAAIGLTTFKFIVGIFTNSLGILAEAAHSGLDLVAAAMTYFAVRVSDKPADKEHTFGHGKIENLSALFETILLLATSGWIIYESIQRLFFINVKVEASIWSFVVMGASIVIDYTRSRLLFRAARKYKCQALEETPSTLARTSGLLRWSSLDSWGFSFPNTFPVWTGCTKPTRLPPWLSL